MAKGALWGPAEYDKLVHGWEVEGKTAGQLALEFGDRTRNSIIGKVHALGLKQAPKPKQRSAYERRKAGEAVGGVRKAYASKGDDITLSRFVKVKTPPGEHKQLQRKQWNLPGLDKPNGAINSGRSLFHNKRVKPVAELPHVLVSGHSNVKIGRDVRKGWLRGYWIYTLTLEERRTCPSSCLHWRTCYGNNMPYPRRVDHTNAAALQAAILRDVDKLLAVKGRRGILVRLHALGDFFDPAYVRFWSLLLDSEPRLAVYGYTAWPRGSEIGQEIAAAKARHGRRFAIRWSNGGRDEDCTVSVRDASSAPPNATVCPEQTGKTAACATCGLCWGSERNIAFVEH